MREAWMVAELSEDTKQTRKRTNPEESSSRQALKKKQVTHVNLKLERVLEDVFKHAWRWRWRSNPAWKVIEFFWMLGNTWLELKKRSNLKNNLLVIYFKSFRSPRNQPPFKRKHLWLQKKKRVNQQVCFFFTHVPCPSKQWNPGSDTAIGFFFSPSCEAE